MDSGMPKKIAIIGTRGIPAGYGGFETLAEELATRLAKKSHQLTVYCHRELYPKESGPYQGARRVFTRGINTKHLAAPSHTLVSCFHVLRDKYDLILVCALPNALFALALKLIGKKVALHVDGLEWQRRKWGFISRQFLKFSEFIIAGGKMTLITDSKAIKKYYQEKYRKETVFIPYGVDAEVSVNPGLIRQYGLEKDSYFLVVARLEPENNTDLIIRAFEGAKTDKKLVIVGGVRYNSKYSEALRQTKDQRIKFLGPVYDKDSLRELYCNSFCYIHGHEVGGTNPALLKALGTGCRILALDVAYNCEVLAGSGVMFNKSADDLKEKIEGLALGPVLPGKINPEYDWDKIAESYLKLA